MNAATAQPIDERTFHDTVAHVLPATDEMKWASIPWQTDLWEARRLAAEQGKPIFAWMMNGNPLGCV
jgi:hypothetical protein